MGLDFGIPIRYMTTSADGTASANNALTVQATIITPAIVAGAKKTSRGSAGEIKSSPTCNECAAQYDTKLHLSQPSVLALNASQIKSLLLLILV